MRKIALLVVLWVCTGCATADSLKEPVKSASLKLSLFTGDSTPLGAEQSIVSAKFNEHCIRENQAEIAAPLIPVATTLLKYWFDSAQDRKLRELKALKKASIKSYSEKLVLDSKAMRQVKCGLLVRHKSKEEKYEIGDIGFIVLIAFKHYEGAFTFEPKVVWAADSVAKTLDRKDKSAINTAIGISIKSLGRIHEDAVQTIVPLGQSVVPVSNVLLQKKNRCAKGCGNSDLIPHPSGANVPTSFTLSVSEIGQTGIDFDVREAEIIALKEAFGPAIKEALKASLEDE
ncbi:MAG: hypothetical protein AAF542_07335 [Pseudomonadota bacterium]